jgi:transposase InsO family protein
VLRRAGCSRLARGRRDPRVRYERERPGELLHVDTKKLGRFFEIGKRIRRDGINRSRRAGWQHLHVAIDDHSRLAYCEILRSERKDECAAFLRRACAWYREQGIVVERVLSDKKAYHSHRWRDTCAELGIERRYTRPYSPWTNGKAEALIKTLSARVGVSLRLPDKRSSRTSALRLPQVVQPTTTARFARGPTPGQPRLTGLWSVHLASGLHRPPAPS